MFLQKQNFFHNSANLTENSLIYQSNNQLIINQSEFP